MHLTGFLAVVNRPHGGRPSMGETREEPPGRHATSREGVTGRSEDRKVFPGFPLDWAHEIRRRARSRVPRRSENLKNLPTFRPSCAPPLFSSAGGFAAWRLPLLFGVVTGVTQADEQKPWTRSMRTCRPQAKPSIGIRSSWPWKRLV